MLGSSWGSPPEWCVHKKWAVSTKTLTVQTQQGLSDHQQGTNSSCKSSDCPHRVQPHLTLVRGWHRKGLPAAPCPPRSGALSCEGRAYKRHWGSTLIPRGLATCVRAGDGAQEEARECCIVSPNLPRAAGEASLLVLEEDGEHGGLRALKGRDSLQRWVPTWVCSWVCWCLPCAQPQDTSQGSLGPHGVEWWWQCALGWVGGSCRLGRGAGAGGAQLIPCLPVNVSGAHVRGDVVPFRLASAMLFSISQGMCLLCESPPLLHGAQLVPARQGMPLLRGFYLIPTTRALCQENTTVQNSCEDVKACPEPSKYRCARASKAPAASVVQRYGCCAFPVAGNLP